MPTTAQPGPNVDIARRILTQRLPLVTSDPQDRQNALQGIHDHALALSTGLPSDPAVARDALLAQQVEASADILALQDLVAVDQRADIQFGAQQILAKVHSAIEEGSPMPRMVASLEALPEELRRAIARDERQAPAHRPN